ncbi:MAG: hypothetical protein JRH01_26460 [Deltaproteobacteria bacterium]|nr:hypothetical protein [Deltaproteobacteria bacterium]MBW2397498.1 hypothetical protein [Deltaproteobacteria bacterium]
MPVLPLIDLLILIAWTGLMWSFVHKALWLALGSTFTVLGLTPYDFVLGGGVCLLFALALAARTWIKANEPALLNRNRPSFRSAESYGAPVEPEARGEAVGAQR